MANWVYLFLVLFSALAYSSLAIQLIVGEQDGWVPKPTENYNHWAERLRFNVNDTLLFNYKKGSDSVLVVNEDDFTKCSSKNPILKMNDGHSIFKFNQSGPFYFISGNKKHCSQGQKMMIIVLAVRDWYSPPAPNAPSEPPASSGGAPAPAPVITPSHARAPSPIDASAPESDDPADEDGDDDTERPHRKSAASALFTDSVVLVMSILSLVLSGFIVSY